ncbi:MAG: molybdopterin-dependent oxidoreductase [Caldilineaceae bacterium]|nr:molybdopterin-dependent oxidoreductase [Caldilineaceae bacterium]
MSTITINGQAIVFAPGATVLEAALAHGIDIPRLCYHPALKPSGGCRLCLVEVAGRPAPAPSCGLLCADGMEVKTENEQLTAMRRDIIDLFVSDHPMTCATCEKDGACDLQSYALRYGVTQTSFDFELSRTLYQDDNPFFVRDHQYCILCGKCVRVCDEIVGRNAIDYSGRGFHSHIATPFDGLMIDSSCVFCSSCVQVCPTTALLPKNRVGMGREVALTHKRTICGYCGVGCAVEFILKDGEFVDAQGFAGAPVNDEFLCVKGRSGWDFISSPKRLTQPLLRRDLAYSLGLSAEPWTLPETSPLKSRRPEEYFVAVSWETAIDIAAQKLAETIINYGADAVAGLSSARCSNEENYLFQKFMRAGVGTNNVDHCARLCHASTVTGLGAAFGSGAMTNTIRGLRDGDCILITGSNTAESHPIISYEVVRAVKSGASLIVIDPRRTPMVDHARLWLQPTPGTDIYVYLAMMHVILREGWEDQAFIERRTEGFADFAAVLAEYTPEVAALRSGVPAEQIEAAARIYALGERKTTSLLPNPQSPVPSPLSRGASSILYAMGITQRTNGTDLVKTLANLSMLCGQIGRPSTGVNPLRGQVNVQGACDLGALPNVLPGYQPVTDDEKRRAVAAVWGLDDLPGENGLTVVEMTHAAIAKKLRAMVVMGENPMLSDPNLSHVEEGLRSLDFLVVQDIFLSETAQLAHIVLPAAASLEKDGTFTNTERRVQLFHPILTAPGDAQPDWQILAALAEKLDEKLGRITDDASAIRWRASRWRFNSTAEILEEAAHCTPIYAGMRHERLAGEGLIWPCPTLDHPGTPILHTERFSRGLGKFHAVTAQLPAEMPDAEYPLILSTGRVLYHYHTGTQTRRSEGLDWREPRAYVEVHPEDAAAVALTDGGPVVLHSRRGQIRTQARITNRVPAGSIFLAFHWREAPANLLTHDFALDPLAKIPEYKVSAVRLENPSRRSR